MSFVKKAGVHRSKCTLAENLSLPTVSAFLFVLLCLLLLFLPQTFTNEACFRFLMKQICHIPLAVVHHHRIVLLAVGGFYTVNGRAFLFLTNCKPCVHQLGGIHTDGLFFQLGVVKRIFDLAIDGKGPEQIARILEQDKVLTTKALYAKQSENHPDPKKRKKMPDRPYHWIGQSVVGILERMEYTGCTCNFKTYSKSYKLKKRIPNAIEDICIFPDIHEVIVSPAQWDRVQELRKNKRRPTKAERQGLFSGLLFCPDCGNKLHFATCKNFDGKQDHYVCSSYKSGRGTCSAHYIREDVLRELVLERIRAVNAYIRSDVEGFQEEWLHYRRADQERDIREDQKRVEQAKKRLATLDVVISRLYEDYALGEISKEKYKKMTADYEAEQERLKLEIETTEEWVEQRQAMGDDLDAFIALTKKYVDVTELTQTIVNEYIRKIIIYAPDKSGGKRRQKVEIIFNFVDEVEIPVLAEPMIAESSLGRRKTA